MQDLPVIIFVLLFFLVLILILLHRSNKQYADKIFVLEQAVELEPESLSSMKEIYESYQNILEVSQLQQAEIENKDNAMLSLEDVNASLKHTIDIQKNEMEQLKQNHENVIQGITEKIFDIEKSSAQKDDEIQTLIKNHEKVVSQYIENLALAKKFSQTHKHTTEMLEQEPEALYHSNQVNSSDSPISHIEVMKYINRGEKKDDVAKRFDITLKRVELIIKFDAIKKSRKKIL